MANAPLLSSASPDGRELQALRREAGRDPRAAARQVAVQFEAHFMEEVFKGMRRAMAPGEEGGMGGGAMGGTSGQETFTGMLDAQFARQFSGRPGGLAEMIEKQLARQMQATPAPAADKPGVASPAPAAPRSAIQSAFLRRMLPHAEAAERATGVPAAFILGQAALESGWGKGEIRHTDGTPSFNLFGVKAGSSWRGEVAVTGTTEYEGGQPVRRQARFRRYASYEQAFTDYARLLAGSPRYAQALRQGDSPERFAGALQRAGYATDPRYADKLARTIHQTLAIQVASNGAAPGDRLNATQVQA